MANSPTSEVAIDKKSPGEELREAREAARLTQLDAAQRVGVDKVTVSRWERGVQRVPVAAYMTLMEFYRSSRSDREVGPARVGESVPRETYSGGGSPSSALSYPRHVEPLVRRMEAEILDAEIPEAQQDALIFALRNPELVTMYRMGYEERQLSAEQQRQQMENHIVKIRTLLEMMVADVKRERRRG